MLGNELNRKIWEAEYSLPSENCGVGGAVGIKSETDDLSSYSASGAGSRAVTIPRPKPTDGYAVRDAFIRAKYQQRSFQTDIVNVVKSIELTAPLHIDEILSELHNFDPVNASESSVFQYPNLVLLIREVCRRDDAPLLASLLAHGALRPCSTAHWLPAA